MTLKIKLYQLADSWDKIERDLLNRPDRGSVVYDIDVIAAETLRICTGELRRVLSELEKKNPDAPRWEIRVLQGECGDSFGECVNEQ